MKKVLFYRNRLVKAYKTDQKATNLHKKNMTNNETLSLAASEVQLRHTLEI